MRLIGRPLRYGEVFEALDDDTLYTPGLMARFAEEQGLLVLYNDEGAVLTDARRRLIKTRIRITLGRFCNNHRFPDEGDGQVTLKGQPPVPGWFGSRWKDAYLKSRGLS